MPKSHLVQCGLVATAVVGKGAGGLAAKQTAVSFPVCALTKVGWERSNSWGAVSIGGGPDRAQALGAPA